MYLDHLPVKDLGMIDPSGLARAAAALELMQTYSAVYLHTPIRAEGVDVLRVLLLYRPDDYLQYT